MDIQALTTGNLLLSGGLDDVDKLKSIADITDVWIEEPLDKRGSILSSDFTELNRRLRSPKASNHIHLTFNPISRESWIYVDFFQTNDYKAHILKTTYKDNYYCPPDQKFQFEVLKSKKPEEYKVYALGEWGSLRQGLVFPEYSIVDAFPANPKKSGYGLDWGFYPDPTALVRCGVYGGGLYLQQIIYEHNLTSESRAARMREAGIAKDQKVIADSNPEAIAELRSKGFINVMPAKKGPGSVKAGIDLMKQFPIFLVAPSEGLKKELDNYEWARDRVADRLTGEPVDAFNHAIDAARYWVSSEYSKQKGIRFA